MRSAAWGPFCSEPRLLGPGRGGPARNCKGWEQRGLTVRRSARGVLLQHRDFCLMMFLNFIFFHSTL